MNTKPMLLQNVSGENANLYLKLDEIQMESRLDISTMGSEDNSVIIPVDQGELEQNSDDVMARRLKNRERQRRYREKKRLQADMKIAGKNANNSASPQRHVQVISALKVDDNRIFCRRNWKQDARSAHVTKQQQIVENGGPLVQYENNFGNSVKEDDIERRVVPGRRKWKTDARNKKD